MLEVGAAPPIGPMLPRAEVVDRRLLEEDRIICAGGDHRHSILLDPREVVRIAGRPRGGRLHRLADTIRLFISHRLSNRPSAGV